MKSSLIAGENILWKFQLLKETKEEEEMFLNLNCCLILVFLLQITVKKKINKIKKSKIDQGLAIYKGQKQNGEAILKKWTKWLAALEV